MMLLRFIDSTTQNSGQSDNVNPTHLVLASGILVLQEKFLSDK